MLNMPQHRFEPNQFHRELMGVLSLSPFDPYNSAARKQMFSSHIGQTLVIDGSTERRIQTGMEREYGKYTFAIKMPCDAEIIRCIDRYPRTLDGSIRHNPETLVIYEDVETKQVGCLSLVDYFSHHQYFGFAYKSKPAAKKLRAREFVAKDTVLMDSPSITDSGGYKYGRECNVAFMAHPAVSEDGILISRDVLEQFKFKTYETREVEWGSTHFPLNLYGDDNNYKPHPDIGDVIRPDGLLMALRSHDELFAPVEQSFGRTREVDHIFDKCVYAAGPGDKVKGIGRVIDIKVQHDPDSARPTTPIGMDVQTTKYNDARLRYYKEIHNEYLRLKRERGARLSLSKEFHRLVVEAISVIGPASKHVEGAKRERVVKIHRGVPLDDWRVEFVIEYEITPTIGFKLTDCHGG